MSVAFKSAKILICLVGRGRAGQLMDVAKKAGARGGTIGLGRTVGDNAILRALALADVQQDILFTLLGPEKEAVQQALLSTARDNPKKFSGYAIVLDVPKMAVRLAPGQETQKSPENGAGSISMESGYELITIITNSGYADDVMAACRKAGATGGTILGARGTGTEEDVKFFGITLVPEKEMLLIVADKGKVEDIIKAASAVPKLAEPGGGVIFTNCVEQFLVLGK
ncbi:P-II family nitrogen regulator [Desulfovibrio sp. OttesenSCG-928-G11]|nr:P-II family nitrogen regulator [Desulfovibrio sp. OttesenSCG-928-G11]